MSAPYKMKGYTYPGSSPMKDKSEIKKKEVKTTYNKDGSYTKSDGTRSTTYYPNPNYNPQGAPGRNYKYVTGKKNPDGTPAGSMGG